MVEVIGDNPYTPGMQSYTYVPDQLIAGNLHLVTDTVDIGGADPLVRGSILGQITATGVYVLSVQTATDGSEVPSAVLVDNVSPGGATVRGGIYELGIFNQNRITFDSSWTLPALKTALRPFSIFLRDSLQAPAS
ncbi:head decoration protein [Enterobacter asburiae]|uniref:head decoration protein n=1 Tax=Enterobacter asburiae TaxID=61645 RepID=UPI003BC831B2